MNNLLQMLGTMRNPQTFIQQISRNNQMMQNPMVKNALEMYQRGDNAGLQKMAENICKERGINRQDFEKQIKSRFGMN